MAIRTAATFNAVSDELKDLLQKQPRTVMKRTMSDAKERVPGWIATEVVKTYAIKKKEIGDGKTSSIKVKGDGIESLQLTYKGRMLTPAHFNMKPGAPKPGSSYTIKATIKKGSRKKIGGAKKLTKKQLKNIGRNFKRQGTRNSPQSPWLLSTTGNTKAGGIDYIPFQRRTQPGELQHVMRTVSVPQMISSDKTTLKPEIAAEVWPKLEKRLEHHLKLLEK